MSGMTEMVDRYRTMATDDLMGAYRDLGGLARAIDAQRLAILAVLDEREAFHIDGCVDAAQWVTATDMVRSSTARGFAASAAALGSLPAISAAMEEGRLSIEQLVPLCELADSETVAEWAEKAPAMSPAALEQLARQKRRVEREQSERQHRRRSFRWWKDRHGLGTRFAGLLPDDAAAVVTKRLDELADEVPPAQEGFEPLESRRADALVEVCSESAGAAGRPELIVNVPVGVEKLAPTLADGTPISIDVVRRLACDGTVRLLVENPDGTVAGYGRRRRIVPDKMRERVLRRDHGRCGWKGCHRTRRLKAHHIQSWIDGGSTEEENAVMLCPRHHSLVHEGGWSIVGNATTGTLEFRRPPWGTPLPASPAPVRTELLKRFGLDAA